MLKIVRLIIVLALLLFYSSFLSVKNVLALCEPITSADPLTYVCNKTGMYTNCRIAKPHANPPINLCCNNPNECLTPVLTPTTTPTPNPGAGGPTPWINPCNDNNKIPTAIGCIDYTSTAGLTKSLLTFAIGIGGGIAFLLMIIGSFMVMTSSGNPERQQAGKEMISSAIMGLLLILLSVFILQLIGVKILAIPGFG